MWTRLHDCIRGVCAGEPNEWLNEYDSKIIFSRSNIEDSPAVCTKAVHLCRHVCLHEEIISRVSHPIREHNDVFIDAKR
jgi:hypothetical protein